MTDTPDRTDADRPDLTRRRLLAGVPLGTVGLVLANPAQAAVDLPQDAVSDPRQPQFTTTDRVAEYYKLARR